MVMHVSASCGSMIVEWVPMQLSSQHTMPHGPGRWTQSFGIVPQTAASSTICWLQCLVKACVVSAVQQWGSAETSGHSPATTRLRGKRSSCWWFAGG
jgi:hypothetical protein